MTEDEKRNHGFKVIDRRTDGDAREEREDQKKIDKQQAKEAVAKQKAEYEELLKQRTGLLKCPNCKWRKQAKRFLQINNPNLPPMIACPKCGALFLHTDYVKNVLQMLAEKEKEEASLK